MLRTSYNNRLTISLRYTQIFSYFNGGGTSIDLKKIRFILSNGVSNVKHESKTNKTTKGIHY